jgi:hypothetical protein
LDTIPNSFLDSFCDLVEKHGMAGKFSIVPAPAGVGDVVRGISGHDPRLTQEWLRTVKKRLAPRWDFCPEGITHNLAVNLKDGGYFEVGENEWSQTQTRETLTPYLTRELSLLKEAGIDATGITSPWVFGIKVEPEYIASIVAAQEAVYGRTFSWYFLHMLHDKPTAKPWIAFQDETHTLVSIPTTVDDFWWETIDSPRTDREFIRSVADKVIAKVERVVEAGGWPVLLTHWQSLFSNGLETGLMVLDEVGRRLPPGLEWHTCMELARMTASEQGF